MIEFGDRRLPHSFWRRVRIRPSSGCWEWVGGRTSHGYGMFWSEGSQWRVHRLVVQVGTRVCPPIVDHACRNRACVNPRHLRAASTKQSSRNRGSFSGAASRFKGVLRDPKRPDWWMSRIYLGGKQVTLGTFGAEEEAARAYDEAASAHHGPFACTNAKLGLLPSDLEVAADG